MDLPRGRIEWICHVEDRSPLSLLNLSASTRGRLSAAMCSGHTHARRLCVIISLFPSRLSVGRDAGGCCAGVPSVFALEGGYNISVNSSSCEAVLRVLLGEAPSKRPEARLSRSCEDTLRAVMQVMREPSHADTWSALYFLLERVVSRGAGTRGALARPARAVGAAHRALQAKGSGCQGARARVQEARADAGRCRL